MSADTCLAIDCSKPARVRGLCGTHYMARYRNASSVYILASPALPPADGCMSSVTVTLPPGHKLSMRALNLNVARGKQAAKLTGDIAGIQYRAVELGITPTATQHHAHANTAALLDYAAGVNPRALYCWTPTLKRGRLTANPRGRWSRLEHHDAWWRA